MLSNPELHLQIHREKMEHFERMNRHRWYYDQPLRRSWKLSKLRHLLFFW